MRLTFKLSAKSTEPMKITTMTKLTLALAATFGLAFIAAADTAQLPPASTKTGVTYATDIKPFSTNPALNVTAATNQKPN